MRKLGIFENDKVSVENNEKIEFKNSYYEFWCKGKEDWMNGGKSLINDGYYNLIFPLDGSDKRVDDNYFLGTRICKLGENREHFRIMLCL